MLGLSKFLPRQLSLVSQCFSVVPKTTGGLRNTFTDNYFGINNFKAYYETQKTRNELNSDTIKGIIKQAVEKPDVKIYTEDLKNFLYLTTTDDEYELLIKAIKKYQTQTHLPVFNFHFDSPLTRLSVVLNKTDRLLQELLSSDESILLRSFMPGTILMHKLYQEGRFDDVSRVFHKLFTLRDKIVERSEKDRIRASEMKYRLLPETIKIYLESLLANPNLEQASKESETIFSALKDSQTEYLLGHKARIVFFLICMRNNKVDLAYELTANRLADQGSVVQREANKVSEENLKIISLIKLNRVDEAINIAKSLLVFTENIQRPRPLKKFFPDTIEALKEAIKNKTPEMINAVDELVARAIKDDLVMRESLKEYATKPKDQRRAIVRDGNVNAFAASLNRSSRPSFGGDAGRKPTFWSRQENFQRDRPSYNRPQRDGFEPENRDRRESNFRSRDPYDRTQELNRLTQRHQQHNRQMNRDDGDEDAENMPRTNRSSKFE